MAVLNKAGSLRHRTATLSAATESTKDGGQFASRDEYAGSRLNRNAIGEGTV